MPRYLAFSLLALAGTPVLAQDVTPPAPAPAVSMPAGQNETRADAEAKATSTFQLLDTNGDGFVTMDEMIAVVAKRMGTTPDKVTTVPPMLKAMMDDADTNHDGKVTLAEAKAAALRGFDEADTNHDGIVTPEERMATRQNVTNAVEPKAKVGR